MQINSRIDKSMRHARADGKDVNCFMKKRTKISHFYISSPDSFFLLQRPAEWERDSSSSPRQTSLRRVQKKRIKKNPAAIDRIEKRKNPAQHTRSMLLHFAMLRQKKSSPLQIDKTPINPPLQLNSPSREARKMLHEVYPRTPRVKVRKLRISRRRRRNKKCPNNNTNLHRTQPKNMKGR